MSSVPCFRDFICDRLTAAAEEIFRVFEKTVLEYEEALSRQRRLLDTASKPQVHLHGFPQQHVYKQEHDEDLTEHQPLNSSSLQQKDPEPSRIKEEQEDLCTIRDEEPLILKQETDIILETDSCEKDGLNEDQTLCLDQSGSHCSTAEEKSVDDFIIERSEVLDPNNENQLLFNRDSSESHNDTEYLFGASKTLSNTHQRKKSSKCEICGKVFNHRSDFIRHQRIHTGVKPYSCNMCGKGFNQSSMLIDHKRVHTGDKPYPCDFCGKKFNRRSAVMVHRRVHTGEKPFSCDMCAEAFVSSTMLKRHMQKHTGEKPFSCLICGKQFYQRSDLKIHTTVHMQ